MVHVALFPALVGYNIEQNVYSAILVNRRRTISVLFYQRVIRDAEGEGIFYKTGTRSTID